MKIELIKKTVNETDEVPVWVIQNEGRFIAIFRTEQEGIEGFDKYVARIQNPPIQPEIIKSITI